MQYHDIDNIILSKTTYCYYKTNFIRYKGNKEAMKAVKTAAVIHNHVRYYFGCKEMKFWGVFLTLKGPTKVDTLNISHQQSKRELS